MQKSLLKGGKQSSGRNHGLRISLKAPLVEISKIKPSVRVISSLSTAQGLNNPSEDHKAFAAKSATLIPRTTVIEGRQGIFYLCQNLNGFLLLHYLETFGDTVVIFKCVVKRGSHLNECFFKWKIKPSKVRVNLPNLTLYRPP